MGVFLFGVVAYVFLKVTRQGFAPVEDLRSKS